jgi:hypothetical protein
MECIELQKLSRCPKHCRYYQGTRCNTVEKQEYHIQIIRINLLACIDFFRLWFRLFAVPSSTKKLTNNVTIACFCRTAVARDHDSLAYEHPRSGWMWPPTSAWPVRTNNDTISMASPGTTFTQKPGWVNTNTRGSLLPVNVVENWKQQSFPSVPVPNSTLLRERLPARRLAKS